jgi:hypothetical protein
MSAATQEGWGTTAAWRSSGPAAAPIWNWKWRWRLPRTRSANIFAAIARPSGLKSRSPGGSGRAPRGRLFGLRAGGCGDGAQRVGPRPSLWPPKTRTLKVFTQTSARPKDQRPPSAPLIYQLLSQADRARAHGDSLRAMSLYRKILTVDPSPSCGARRGPPMGIRRQSRWKNARPPWAPPLRNARAEEAAGRPRKGPESIGWRSCRLEPLHSEARERLAAFPRTVGPPPGSCGGSRSLSPRQAEQFYALGLVRYAAGDLSRRPHLAFAHCLKLNAQHPRAVKALARVREEERPSPVSSARHALPWSF